MKRYESSGKKHSGQSNKEVQHLTEQLDEHLKLFLAERHFNTKSIIQEIKKRKLIVNQLSEQLGKVTFITSSRPKKSNFL